jgi:hypothetical protein
MAATNKRHRNGILARIGLGINDRNITESQTKKAPKKLPVAQRIQKPLLRAFAR